MKKVYQLDFGKSVPRFGILILFYLLPFQWVNSQSDRNLNFMFGFTIMNTDLLDYTWGECLNDNPKLNLSSGNFDSYQMHGNGSNDYFIMVPTSISFEYGKSIKRFKREFWKRSIQIFRLTLEYTSFYYNNREYTEYRGMALSGNEIWYRDFYEVYMDGVLTHFTYGFHHFSNYKGKEKRTRLWFGLAMVQGWMSPHIDMYNTKGIFEKEYYPNSNYPHYNWMEGNPPTTRNIYITSSKRWLAGFTIPFGIEKMVGKKKRTHIGFQYSIGNIWAVGKDRAVISSFYFSGGANFRFSLTN